MQKKAMKTYGYQRAAEFAGKEFLMVAYFIRRSGNGCAVIELHPDDREEVVQGGLTLIEAEILCAMRIADLPKSAPPQIGDELPALRQRVKPRRDARQLALKF
jgi:hypothetical protein